MTARICFTRFSAASLACKPQLGTSIATTWDRLVAWCGRPIVTGDKASGGGFVLAQLRDGIRRNAHVVSVPAIGIDHDAGAVTAAHVHEVLSAYERVVYTTFSHQPDAPRWRCVLLLSRVVTFAEYKAIRPIVEAHFVAAEIVTDRGAKDGCRLWYVPAIRPGAAFEHYVGHGAPLDVERLLGIAREQEAEREEERRRRPPPAALSDAERHDRYLRGAIDRAVASIANGTEGERHYLVCREAYSLARFGLGEARILDLLTAPAVQAMGESRRHEIERTIRDAVRARGAA